MHGPILSTVIFLPAVGALVLGLIRLIERYGGWRPTPDVYRVGALFFAVLTFLFSLSLFFLFNGRMARAQFSESYTWIAAWSARYIVGLDGISILLFMLTTFLTPLALMSAWPEIRDHVPGFAVAMLLLETGMLGVFAARDLLLFYVFWEVTLIPMFFIIFVWGGPQRVYAAIKFLLYTLVGSLAMLVGILYLYMRTGGQTFAYDALREMVQRPGVLSFGEQLWLFAAFALAFLIKLPALPFHTWLPAAHVEAPTAGSVILAGVLLKMGGYGLLRFCIGLFPHATLHWQWPLVLLGAVGVVYGSWAALAQRDIKRLVAYSSIAHLGLVLVGIFALTPQAVQGALLQMVNHGLSTGALFMLVGVLYQRRHTRDMDAYGGVAGVAPWLYAVFLITTLSSIGFPLLNGFVGEFLILWGGFQRYPRTALIALTGVVWSAVYMLRLVLKVFYGPGDTSRLQGFRDLTRWEKASFIPILLLMFGIGLFPGPFLTRTARTVQVMTAVLQRLAVASGGP